MMTKFNYYMLLSPSPWPLIISINSFNVLFSILSMLSGLANMIYFNLMVMIMSCFMWFKDLEMEYNMKGMMSLNLEKTMKLFFILFILSEIMVFFSMFWCYYSYFMVKELDMMKWPNYSIIPFKWSLMPMINTLLLITSSITLTVSHWMLNINCKKKMDLYLIYTILLGMMFTFLQYKEYSNSFYSMNDGNFGSIFFILTGLHGLHVILGTVILMSCMLKSMSMSNFISSSESFEMGSWYWHFVDLVWIFVLYSLYYLN